MSTQAVEWAWRVVAAERMAPTPALVLHRMAWRWWDERHGKEGQAWAVAALARECGRGTTATREALRELERRGHILPKPATGDITSYWLAITGDPELSTSPTESGAPDIHTPTESVAPPNGKRCPSERGPQRKALPSRLKANSNVAARGVSGSTWRATLAPAPNLSDLPDE